MYQFPDGRITKHLRKNKFFRIGDVNHPETNLLYWDDEAYINHGCFRIVEEAKPDQRYFNTTGQTEVIEGAVKTITYTKSRKYSIKKMKRIKIREARKIAGTLIKLYEWHITRSIQDPSFPIRADISAYITAVRASVATIETEVKALTTYLQVIRYNFNEKWPVNPPDVDDPLNGDLQE